MSSILDRVFRLLTSWKSNQHHHQEQLQVEEEEEEDLQHNTQQLDQNIDPFSLLLNREILSSSESSLNQNELINLNSLHLNFSLTTTAQSLPSSTTTTGQNRNPQSDNNNNNNCFYYAINDSRSNLIERRENSNSILANQYIEMMNTATTASSPTPPPPTTTTTSTTNSTINDANINPIVITNSDNNSSNSAISRVNQAFNNFRISFSLANRRRRSTTTTTSARGSRGSRRSNTNVASSSASASTPVQSASSNTNPNPPNSNTNSNNNPLQILSSRGSSSTTSSSISSNMNNYDLFSILKKRERNFLSAICAVFSIAVLSVSLVETRWFFLNGGGCNLNYIGVAHFFAPGRLEYQIEVSKITKSEIIVYNFILPNGLVLKNCANREIIIIMRTVIAFVFLAIFSSCIGLMLDTFGFMKSGVKLIRRHAIFHILTVIFCLAINGFCFWISERMNEQQNETRHKKGKKVDVSFDFSYYLVVLASGLSILATAFTLIRRYPTDEDEQLERLLEEYTGFEEPLHLERSLPATMANPPPSQSSQIQQGYSNHNQNDFSTNTQFVDSNNNSHDDCSHYQRRTTTHNSRLNHQNNQTPPPPPSTPPPSLHSLNNSVVYQPVVITEPPPPYDPVPAIA